MKHSEGTSIGNTNKADEHTLSRLLRLCSLPALLHCFITAWVGTLHVNSYYFAVTSNNSDPYLSFFLLLRLLVAAFFRKLLWHAWQKKPWCWGFSRNKVTRTGFFIVDRVCLDRNFLWTCGTVWGLDVPGAVSERLQGSLKLKTEKLIMMYGAIAAPVDWGLFSRWTLRICWYTVATISALKYGRRLLRELPPGYWGYWK